MLTWNSKTKYTFLKGLNIELVRCCYLQKWGCYRNRGYHKQYVKCKGKGWIVFQTKHNRWVLNFNVVSQK